ncbi:RNA polymerase sigma factor [Fimbriiglobus ruber]|uniref:RNA polymerase sigma factor n=1 Tax=Fimbriiglobus ruber TaxID=1908690 RepID=UPI001379D474|nr:sigma-70 family RNA polymerase sigma factor [Fimbriiglobus ruber]
MLTTSVSLLQRLRRGTDPGDWHRFVRLYTPLLLDWARRAGAQDADAADLVQDVLLILVNKLPAFQYDEDRSFRSWVRTILLNKWRDGRRLLAARLVVQDLDALPAPADDQEEREERQRLVARALDLIRGDFHPHVWRAFWEFFAADRPAAAVAAELGVSVDVVYSAKCRILRRLRQELDGLLD